MCVFCGGKCLHVVIVFVKVVKVLSSCVSPPARLSSVPCI